MPVPTPRLLLIALGGCIVIPLAAGAETAVLLAGCWLAAVCLLALVDTRSLPPRRSFTWTRHHDDKLSLGAWNTVTLVLENRSAQRVTLRVRDAVPPQLVSRDESGAGECAPGARWELRYRVYPIHRGDYSFGPVSARYLGPLGLAWWPHSTSTEDRVKVYPDFAAVRTYEALVRRGRLEEIGLRSSRRWGSGTEFERLRDYTPDDEFRRINWNATARRHRLIAVDYETERSQNLMLLIDAGRLMSTRVPLHASIQDLAAGSEGRWSLPEDGPGRPANGRGAPHALTRLDYAVNAALLLAFVSQRHGDRVGLLAFGDRVTRYVSPAPGRRQFLTLAEALYNLQAESTEANYAEAIGHLAVRNPRRALIVLFTDIADPEAASTLVSLLGRLARRHLPLVVTLRDPAIEQLALLPPASSTSLYQRAVARALLEDREQTLRRLRQLGALTLDVAADQLSPSLINRYLEIKARSAL